MIVAILRVGYHEYIFVPVTTRAPGIYNLDENRKCTRCKREIQPGKKSWRPIYGYRATQAHAPRFCWTCMPEDSIIER